MRVQNEQDCGAQWRCHIGRVTLGLEGLVNFSEWSRVPLIISFELQTLPSGASRPCSGTWSLEFAIGARQTGHEPRGFKGGRRIARGRSTRLMALG